jgi:Helicase HerA-like C-terminal
MADFADAIAAAYATQGPALDLGCGVHDGAVAPHAVVRAPLSMMNRHGLVAGATGTGKTKTLQQTGAAVAGGAAVLGKFLTSRQGKTVEREAVRGLFGLLKKSL